MAGQAALQKRETLANNSAPKEYFDVSIVTRLAVYQCRKQTNNNLYISTNENDCTFVNAISGSTPFSIDR